MNHDIYNYTPRCNWFHCKCKEQNQSFILTLRWVRGCVVARVSASDIYPSQPARPPKPCSALHYKDLQLYLKLCKLLAWIKPSEQKLSPMEKFIEIVDTFFFNLRSTSFNLIALGIAMAGWNFMHLRCTDQGMMDLQVWTIRSGGASVYLEALGKQRSTLETQLWSADDNPTSAFTSLFTIANDKWINLSFRTRHSLQNNVGWELGWIRGGLRQLRSVLWWDKTSPKESS